MRVDGLLDVHIAQTCHCVGTEPTLYGFFCYEIMISARPDTFVVLGSKAVEVLPGKSFPHVHMTIQAVLPSYIQQLGYVMTVVW